MKQTCNKLVRDRIPEIIRASGHSCRLCKLDTESYRSALREKLQEEVDEFHESGSIEELADILEVVYALADVQGKSSADLETVRLQKREERGGFTCRIYLEEVEA